MFPEYQVTVAKAFHHLWGLQFTRSVLVLVCCELKPEQNHELNLISTPELLYIRGKCRFYPDDLKSFYRTSLSFKTWWKSKRKLLWLYVLFQAAVGASAVFPRFGLERELPWPSVRCSFQPPRGALLSAAWPWAGELSPGQSVMQCPCWVRMAQDPKLPEVGRGSVRALGPAASHQH